MANITVPEEAKETVIGKYRWLREPGTLAEFPFSRTKLYQLSKEGKIISVSLRESEQKKATRLFDANSIEAYIESFLPKTDIDGGTAA